MAEIENNQRLYIVSRESVVEARRLVEADNNASILLVGRGLFLPVKLFGDKTVFAIDEEVKEQGLKDHIDKRITCLSSEAVVEMLFRYTVLNFS